VPRLADSGQAPSNRPRSLRVRPTLAELNFRRMCGEL
jgi:hypothetical protein